MNKNPKNLILLQRWKYKIPPYSRIRVPLMCHMLQLCKGSVFMGFAPAHFQPGFDVIRGD